MSFHTAMESRFAEMQSLKALRKLAWERYDTLGLPTKKSEAYRYVKLRALLNDFPDFADLAESTVQAVPSAKFHCASSHRRRSQR